MTQYTSTKQAHTQNIHRHTTEHTKHTLNTQNTQTLDRSNMAVPSNSTSAITHPMEKTSCEKRGEGCLHDRLNHHTLNHHTLNHHILNNHILNHHTLNHHILNHTHIQSYIPLLVSVVWVLIDVCQGCKSVLVQYSTGDDHQYQRRMKNQPVCDCTYTVTVCDCNVCTGCNICTG